MSVSFNVVGFVDRRTADLKDRGDAIERRRLQPITVKPVVRPMFSNKGVLDFATWQIANLQALTEYWNALTTAGDAEILGEEDFFIFCRIQHERELDMRDEFKRAYGSSRDTL